MNLGSRLWAFLLVIVFGLLLPNLVWTAKRHGPASTAVPQFGARLRKPAPDSSSKSATTPSTTPSTTPITTTGNPYTERPPAEEEQDQQASSSANEYVVTGYRSWQDIRQPQLVDSLMAASNDLPPLTAALPMADFLAPDSSGTPPWHYLVPPAEIGYHEPPSAPAAAPMTLGEVYPGEQLPQHAPIAALLSEPRDGIPGLPWHDYPAFEEVPHTSFQCHGMYGFFADMEAGCQVWHYCQPDGRHDSFLCANGTLFNQATRVCDWWYNVDCPASLHKYAVNHDLYQR